MNIKKYLVKKNEKLFLYLFIMDLLLQSNNINLNNINQITKLKYSKNLFDRLKIIIQNKSQKYLSKLFEILINQLNNEIIDLFIENGFDLDEYLNKNIINMIDNKKYFEIFIEFNNIYIDLFIENGFNLSKYFFYTPNKYIYYTNIYYYPKNEYINNLFNKDTLKLFDNKYAIYYIKAYRSYLSDKYEIECICNRDDEYAKYLLKHDIFFSKLSKFQYNFIFLYYSCCFTKYLTHILNIKILFDMRDEIENQYKNYIESKKFSRYNMNILYFEKIIDLNTIFGNFKNIRLNYEKFLYHIFNNILPKEIINIIINYII